MTKQAEKRKPPIHACLDNLTIENNELVFAGRTVSRLVDLAGQTPFYAYDRAKMAAQVNKLRNTLPAFIHLHFAMKANPHPAVTRYFSTLVDGLDVASAGELEVALDTGIEAGLISFAGPGKRPEELRRAIEAGIIINMESTLEMERISRIGAELGIKPKVAIRVNPDFELKTSGMKMGGGAKQFGIDAEQVPEVLRQLAKLNLDFWGLHIFCGSQNLNAESICEAQTRTVDLAVRLSREAPSAVRILNIGGGFGIPYFPGEKYLDLAPVAENLERLHPKIRNTMPDAEVVIELGRYLVGEAGIYVCKVLDRKVSRGEIFLVTDGGLHHHLAASGNFGQIIRKNYPVVAGNHVKSPDNKTASVVGPLCTPLDLLAAKMNLGHAGTDDLIVILQSGAYGYTASPHLFLSHPAPVEIFP